MKFLSNKVSPTVVEMTYKMYVCPHLDFGDLIYHNQMKDMMDKLESIQYQAALIVSNCWQGTSKFKLYNELGWETLSQRREFRRLSLYYKILNNKTPAYLKNHIQPPKQNATNRYSNSFFPFCQTHWNTLSAELQNAVSIEQFKTKYKKAYFPTKRPFFKGQDRHGISMLLKLRV